jgi:hypothetical protein
MAVERAAPRRERSQPQGAVNIPIKWVDTPIFKHDLMTERDDGCFYRPELTPGSARFDHGDRTFSYACPCGCGLVNLISVYRGNSGHGWKLTGPREKPSLQPSIQQMSKCRWHGHVTKGEFVKA